MNKWQQKTLPKVLLSSLYTLFLGVLFGTCCIWGACRRCLACIWKCEFGAWPRGRELEVIHQEVITAMDAIQEITAFLKTYPNTLQLWIFQTEDGIHVEKQSPYSISNQPCSHIAKPSRSQVFPRSVHAPSYSNTGTRDQSGPGDREAGWPYTAVCLSIVLIYVYCSSTIINSTPFTLKSVPV